MNSLRRLIRRTCQFGFVKVESGLPSEKKRGLRPMNAEQMQIIDRRLNYRIRKRKCKRRNGGLNAAFFYENCSQRWSGLRRVVRRRYSLPRYHQCKVVRSVVFQLQQFRKLSQGKPAE